MTHVPRAIRGAVVVLVVAVAAALGAAPAGARTMPPQQPLRILVVQRLTHHDLTLLARRGAVGLLVPGVGPRTNRRQALSALVRGRIENSRLGGVARGPVRVAVSAATGFPTGHPLIVVTLPPPGKPILNDRRYPIAVLGRGYHGLLLSRTTRLPGVVSILDIAPTALQSRGLELLSRAQPDAARAVQVLDARIGANNQLKLPALIAVAVLVGFLALFRPGAAFLAIPAALLGSLGLGFLGPTSVVVLVVGFVLSTLLGALLLERVCSTESRLLLLVVGLLAAYAVTMALDPTAAAINPLGPTQNSRFFGVGNQVETLLLGPVLAAAGIAGRRFGLLGFLAVGGFAFVAVAENDLGADGGGAVVFAVALAVFAALLLRLRWSGLAAALGLAAVSVLGLMAWDESHSGLNHMHSAFAHGFSGLVDVVRNRVPLSYLPAIHGWPYVGPFLLAFVVAAALTIRAARRHDLRALLVALSVAVAASLLVNDSAAYELVGATTTLAALHGSRFRFGPLRVFGLRPFPVPEPGLVVEAASTESTGSGPPRV